MAAPTSAPAFLGLLEAPGEAQYLVVSDDGRPRWALPSSRSALLLSSLRGYSPPTPKAVLGWQAARAVAVMRLGSLLPGSRRRAGLPLGRSLVELLGRDRIHVAVASSFEGTRCMLCVLDDSAGVLAFVKLALPGTEDAHHLLREARILAQLESRGPAFLFPGVIFSGTLDGFAVLVLTPVAGHSRLLPWRLDQPVVDAAVRLFDVRDGETSLGSRLATLRAPNTAWSNRLAATRDAIAPFSDQVLPTGLSHGDFAPWNLLHDRGRVGLVDWEAAQFDGLPFWDLCHFAVQASGVSGLPSANRPVRQVLRHGRGEGRLAAALIRYAYGVGLPPHLGRSVLLVYLLETGLRLAEKAESLSPAHQRALAYRERLLDEAVAARGMSVQASEGSR